MNETSESLSHQIAVAAELSSVVRTMKALAAAEISQYELAVRSLEQYDASIQLGLAACLRELPAFAASAIPSRHSCGLIVFGSDQGLVGQFNGALHEFIRGKRSQWPERTCCWLVGEKLYSEWMTPEIRVEGTYPVPLAVAGITPLIRDLLQDIDRQREMGAAGDVYVIHQRPVGQSGFEPVIQQLLPLSGAWREGLSNLHWPGGRQPELIGGVARNGPLLIREYLFIALYRACAESLAGENAARLAAMQHAEKNIDELRDRLVLHYQRLRQETIDEELFDVVFGSEALAPVKPITQLK